MLPSGWSTGAHATSGLTWSAAHEPAPRLYAEVIDPSAVPEPLVDAVIDAEYERNSVSRLPNLAVQTGKPGELWLETLASGKRFLALRIPKGSGGAAALTLLIDQDRVDTLSGTACGQHGTGPDAADRRFLIELDASLGEASSITQTQGSCSTGAGAWSGPVVEDDEWIVDAVASESLDDPGYIHFCPAT